MKARKSYTSSYITNKDFKISIKEHQGQKLEKSVSVDVELPCLSMSNYSFSKNEVRKRKKEISKNIKIANKLIAKELQHLANVKRSK